MSFNGDIVKFCRDNSEFIVDNDERLIEPTLCSEYIYSGEQFHQLRCGSALHLAIHDKGLYDANANANAFSYNDYINNPEKVNERDEFGNTALHTVAIVAYNTGNYTEIKNVILFLQSVGIKRNYCVNNQGDTAIDLLDRMIVTATENADDPYSSFYDRRMFENHAWNLDMIREFIIRNVIV